MTSKATLLCESRLKLAGFVEHELIVPLKPGEKKRRLWLSPDVAKLLSGQKNPDAGFPHVSADRDVGRFGRGYIVSVSRRQGSRAEFKWLKQHDEAWVYSFRKPPPGWRILGRFARKSWFVGLCYYEREELADLATYNARISDMIGQWEATFPGVEPHRGKGFEDYLGEMHRNDDE